MASPSPPTRPPTASSAHPSGRVLYPTGDRSSQPAGVLQSADLTPEMLANNLRAGLFPEKGQRIRNTIEQSLARQAWAEVSAIERLHRRSCPSSKLKHIRSIHNSKDATATPNAASPADAAAAGSSAAPSSSIVDYQLPVPTRLYSRMFQERPFPHLTIFKASPLPPVGPIDSPQSPPSTSPQPSLPSPLAPPSSSTAPVPTLDLSSPPSPIVYYGARVLGSEMWTVDRCSVEQSYLVTYYGDGDAFYSDVYPVNWSGAFDCLRLRIQRLLNVE